MEPDAIRDVLTRLLDDSGAAWTSAAGHPQHCDQSKTDQSFQKGDGNMVDQSVIQKHFPHFFYDLPRA